LLLHCGRVDDANANIGRARVNWRKIQTGVHAIDLPLQFLVDTVEGAAPPDFDFDAILLGDLFRSIASGRARQPRLRTESGASFRSAAYHRSRNAATGLDEPVEFANCPGLL
jgi:hypothetical protein